MTTLARKLNVAAVVAIGTMAFVLANQAHSLWPLVLVVLAMPNLLANAALAATASRRVKILALVLSFLAVGGQLTNVVQFFASSTDESAFLLSLSCALFLPPAVLNVGLLYPQVTGRAAVARDT